MLLSCCINLVKLQKCWLSKILGMTYNLERMEYLIFPEIIKLIGSWQKSSNHPRALSKFIFLFHTWNEYPWSKNSIQKSECYQFSLDWSWWCFRCKVAAAISFQCLVHAVDKTSTEGQHKNVNLILVMFIFAHILLTCKVNFAHNHIAINSVILFWGFL